MLFVSTQPQTKLVFVADKGKSKDTTTVGDLVTQTMAEQGHSTRDIDRLTEQVGHRIAYLAVSRIRNGRQKPNRDQLRVLSKVLQIPLKQLQTAMRIHDRFTLPEYADRLSTTEREAIRNLIQVMVESKDEKENANEPRNVAQFQAVTYDQTFEDIAARNWRKDDPDLGEDLMGDT